MVRSVPWHASPSDAEPDGWGLGEEPEPRAVLLSFDIDGTLEDGDPSGPLAMSLATQALESGYVVGSGSDRTLRDQTRMWERRGIEADFVSHKHTLHHVAARFPALRRVHIGDTHVDEYYAGLAGFEFVLVTTVPEDPTLADLLSLPTPTP
jgi:hypothetical protein